MAVQEWKSGSTSNIAEGDVTSAYNDLLVNINKCLHMRKSLETERTFTENVMDRAARQRGNIPRLLELMGDFKVEVEEGLDLIMTLIRKINEVELIDMSDEKIKKFAYNTMSSHVKDLGDIRSRFFEAVETLLDVGILKGKKESGFGAILSNFLSFFTDRNTKYAELQSLFESINDPKLMGVLKTAHCKIKTFIKQIDELTKNCEAHAIKYKTERREELEYKTKQLEYTTRAITLEKNTIEDGVKAVKIFVNTKSEELRELVATEPGMRENDRERIATRAAVRNCKTFLMEKLRYSNAEADELINKIKN